MTIKSAKGATDATKTVSADDIEILARKVAYHIYLHAFKDKQQGWAPKWEHFQTVDGFEYYQLGLDHQKKGRLGDALKEFREAARLEPGNVLTRLAAASVLTQQCQDPKGANAKTPKISDDNVLEARRIYERIVESYPDLIEPRYRLAANLSMWEGGEDDFNRECEEIRKRLSIRFWLKKLLVK